MPWPRSELTIQASNEFGLDVKVPWAQLLLRNRFIWVTENEVGPIGRWTRRAARGNFSSKIILATKQDRAIDLSCRACGAGAWALGLDSRWGSPLRSVFHPQPPIGHSGNEAVGSPIKLKKNSQIRKADKSRTEKSSISNLWEHFLVSEHRSPIWLLLGSKFSSYSHGKPCNFLVKSTMSHRKPYNSLLN